MNSKQKSIFLSLLVILLVYLDQSSLLAQNSQRNSGQGSSVRSNVRRSNSISGRPITPIQNSSGNSNSGGNAPGLNNASPRASNPAGSAAGNTGINKGPGNTNQGGAQDTIGGGMGNGGAGGMGTGAGGH